METFKIDGVAFTQERQAVINGWRDYDETVAAIVAIGRDTAQLYPVADTSEVGKARITHRATNAQLSALDGELAQKREQQRAIARQIDELVQGDDGLDVDDPAVVEKQHQIDDLQITIDKLVKQRSTFWDKDRTARYNVQALEGELTSAVNALARVPTQLSARDRRTVEQHYQRLSGRTWGK